MTEGHDKSNIALLFQSGAIKTSTQMADPKIYHLQKSYPDLTGSHKQVHIYKQMNVVVHTCILFAPGMTMIKA